MTIDDALKQVIEPAAKELSAKLGYQLDAVQIAEMTAKMVNAGIDALNAWPNAKKAGEAEASKVTDAASAAQWNKEH